MSVYIVTSKATGKEVYRYEADAPIEWNGMEFATHDHTEFVGVVLESSGHPVMWRIHVGAFFDRFGEYKFAILASQDPLVQALIKDVSVRQYVAITERRAELQQAIAMLTANGFAIDPAAILDHEPTADEVWNGN